MGKDVGKLDGKVAIISGGGGEIARGVALAFAKEGADLCLAELDAERATATAREVEKLGRRALAIRCDVSQHDQVDAAVAETVSELGGIDVLINNATAGMRGPARKTLLEHTEEDLDRHFAVDVKGTFLLMRACFPHFEVRGRGKIINLASAAGSERLDGFATYAAAKEAIRALTGVAAREWGPHHINVNVVCPGAKTAGIEKFLADYPEYAEQTLAGIPLGRLGDPEADIGRALVFLASSDSDFITGQTLWVDGGQVIHS